MTQPRVFVDISVHWHKEHERKYRSGDMYFDVLLIPHQFHTKAYLKSIIVWISYNLLTHCIEYISHKCWIRIQFVCKCAIYVGHGHVIETEVSITLKGLFWVFCWTLWLQQGGNAHIYTNNGWQMKLVEGPYVSNILLVIWNKSFASWKHGHGWVTSKPTTTIQPPSVANKINSHQKQQQICRFTLFLSFQKQFSALTHFSCHFFTKSLKLWPFVQSRSVIGIYIQL